MTAYVFVGPSVPRAVREHYSSHAVILPPIAAGDLLRLPCQPGDVVVIIDGFFHRRQAVRHKEILHLIHSGVEVHGVSSMGALRACELAAFGMIGHGRIFSDYAQGLITADDEVALLHGTADDDYESFTEALVNIRYALSDASTRGHISSEIANAILSFAARLPFSSRTFDFIEQVARESGMGENDLMAVSQILRSRPDVKCEDALAALKQILERSQSPQRNVPPLGLPAWHLRRTLFLRQWQSAASGSPEADVGWIPESSVHRLAQVLADDYAAFRESVAIKVLAKESASAGSGERSTGEPHNTVDVEAAIERARELGLFQTDKSDYGIDQWCTKREGHLPENERILKAASRALFHENALAWRDPFLIELKATGSYNMLCNRLAQCTRFNDDLHKRYPNFHSIRIRPERILSYFSKRWERHDLEDAALERGFSDLQEFISAARTFYLYDKVHPQNRPLLVNGRSNGDAQNPD